MRWVSGRIWSPRHWPHAVLLAQLALGLAGRAFDVGADALVEVLRQEGMLGIVVHQRRPVQRLAALGVQGDLALLRATQVFDPDRLVCLEVREQAARLAHGTVLVAVVIIVGTSALGGSERMHLMGSNPIPWKSDKLHYVQLDNWSADQPYYEDGRPPDQVTYQDAVALMKAGKADKQAAMFKLSLPVQPENKDLKPFQSLGRVTYADFFTMFEPKFKYGAPWNHDQDESHARVVVLGKDINEKLFGGQDSTGKSMQISIAQTLPGLPPFRQQAGYTAYIEGWALYAERLGEELGFFQDPLSYYGHLSDELLRADRLVLDTGVHYKHWTRDQMISYFREHSSQDEPSIQSETDRYISTPAQALAYKVGQLKILDLRARAKKELGDKFDIRAFHDEILDGGALPLDVLDQRVTAWIAATKAGKAGA